MRSRHEPFPPAPAMVPAAWPALACEKHADVPVSFEKYADEKLLLGPFGRSGRLYGSPGMATAAQPVAGSMATDMKSARVRLPGSPGMRPHTVPCVQMSP